MVVYQLTLANGKRYIGSTRRPLVARLAEHLSAAMHPHRNRNHASLIYPALRKHGWAGMRVEVLVERVTVEELVSAEGAFIAIAEPEYNMRIPAGAGGANSRYDDLAKKEMLEMFNAGHRLQAIARHFGCHPTVVGDHLGALGVTKEERMSAGAKSRRVLTDDQEATVLSLVRSGMTVSAAAVCAGVSYVAAKGATKRAQVSTKDAANEARRARFDVDLAIALWRSGLSLKEVGDKFGVSSATVNRYIRKGGVGAEEIANRKGCKL